MRRIYFLVPNQESVRRIVDELLLMRVEEPHIHVLAKQKTSLEQVPEATMLEKSDFVPALQRGAAIGGTVGLFGGLAALALPVGLVLAGGAVLVSTLTGAALGAWIATLIGVSVPNTQLEKFEEALEQGEILMLVDIEEDRIDELKKLVLKHHPEAEFEGVEPKVKVVPQKE